MMHLSLLLVFALSDAEPQAVDVPLQAGTRVRFGTVEEGRKVLTTRDAYISAQSPFDRAARLMTDRDVGEEEYLEYVGSQVRAWQDEEIDKLSAIVTSVQSKLLSWKLPLPESVLLIKTTGREEGNAAYCRGNAVVFPQRYVDRPAESLERTFVHELFHILSRNNPDLREGLYAIVGFQPRGRIDFPESLGSRKITNPDAVEIEYAIRVVYDEQPLEVTPVLYASTDRYDVEKGGPFFRYLTFRLMVVEANDGRWVPRLLDGHPQMLEPSEVAGFHEQIGRNTRYIIHPEEVLADNFVLLIDQEKDVATPRILREMERLLRKE